MSVSYGPGLGGLTACVESFSMSSGACWNKCLLCVNSLLVSAVLGLSLQDESCLRSLSHQCHHQQRRKCCGDQEFPRTEEDKRSTRDKTEL